MMNKSGSFDKSLNNSFIHFHRNIMQFAERETENNNNNKKEEL